MKIKLTHQQIDAIIGMAWADRVTFEEIFQKTGLREADVITLMRQHLKRSSFNRWRKRVSGRITKHRKILKRCTQTLPDPDEQLSELFLSLGDLRQRSEQ